MEFHNNLDQALDGERDIPRLDTTINTISGNLFAALDTYTRQDDDRNQASSIVAKLESKRQELEDRQAEYTRLTGDLAIINATLGGGGLSDAQRTHYTQERNRIQSEIDRMGNQYQNADGNINAGTDILGTITRNLTNHRIVQSYGSYCRFRIDRTHRLRPGIPSTIDGNAELFTQDNRTYTDRGGNTALFNSTFDLPEHTGVGGTIELHDIDIGGTNYPDIIVTHVDFDNGTGEIRFNNNTTVTDAAGNPITSDGDISLPITLSNTTQVPVGGANRDVIHQSSLNIVIPSNKNPENENILREPTEFDLTTRMGQANRIDQHFYNNRPLPTGTNFHVLDTYNRSSLTPPTTYVGNNRSVLHNITINGVEYREVRLRTSIQTRSNGTKMLTVTHAEYVDHTNTSWPMEEGVLDNITLPIEADFDGDKVEKNINLTVNLEEARPLPPDINNYVGLDLHQNLPKPTTATAFEYEGYDYNYTPSDGWTMKDPSGNIIYHKGKFDLANHTERLTQNMDTILGFKTGFKESDTKTERGAKRVGNVAKRVILGPTGILGYHGFKKIGKRTTNMGVNSYKLRNKTLKHIRGRIGQVALTGLYKGYFQTEYDKLNPENNIYTEINGYRYSIHQGNITVTAAGTVHPHIAQEPLDSDAGRDLIRGPEDQKLGVGYQLTLAMRQDNRGDRSLGETIGDSANQITDVLKLSTPHSIQEAT